MLVAVQLSVPGLYLPPVFEIAAASIRPRRSFHCQSTLPCDSLGQSGALVVLVAVQLSVLGIVSPASVQRRCRYHIRPRRSFHCRSRLPCDSLGAVGRIGGAGSCPTIRAGIVSPASVQNVCSHHIRPRRSFHCRSRPPCDCIGQRAHWSVLVAVQLSVPGLYLPPVFKWHAVIISTPDDHFAAGPHCRVIVSGSRAH